MFTLPQGTDNKGNENFLLENNISVYVYARQTDRKLWDMGGMLLLWTLCRYYTVHYQNLKLLPLLLLLLLLLVVSVWSSDNRLGIFNFVRELQWKKIWKEHTGWLACWSPEHAQRTTECRVKETKLRGEETRKWIGKVKRIFFLPFLHRCIFSSYVCECSKFESIYCTLPVCFNVYSVEEPYSPP